MQRTVLIACGLCFVICGCTAGPVTQKGGPKSSSEAAPPVYIDKIYLTLWTGSEADAGTPGSDLWLEIGFTSQGVEYGRTGEMRFIKHAEMVPDAKYEYGSFSVPDGFSRLKRGSFVLVNAQVLNNWSIQLVEARVVGQRTENGETTYWVLAERKWPRGRWLQSVPSNDKEGPAVTIDTLDTWRQVDGPYPN